MTTLRTGGSVRLRIPCWLVVMGALSACAADAHAALPAAGADSLELHVPSPDWRDQIVYFVVTDRFDDADPTNNDQGAGEFDPASNAKYNGGDLRGIARRLDYIRGLGATAIWITPPVANRWWDPQANSAGYHGYWAENFKTVDRHLGTLDDYRRLSDSVHRAGMYLIQDIVVNHTGNYFSWNGAWNSRKPAANFVLNADADGRTAPSQWPFSLNDARDPTQRRFGAYHWTPDIANYNDRRQLLDFQIAGLDDINTENPVVRRALRESYGYWIRTAGVDAFRIDTAFYVPPDFFRDFLFSTDRASPGIFEAARRTGRNAFHVFGEGFGIDSAYASTQERRIERYVHTPGGAPLLPGMLSFPLYGTIGDVFARGRPTAELGYRIRTMMRVHRNPYLMPTFVDNHDVDRFLAGGSEAALKQSLLLLMTLPGIPVIYYGTEQGFTEPRAAMFRNGYKSGGTDRFDESAPLYRFIQRIAALRRADKVFSRGTPRVIQENDAGPGALAYRMTYGKRAAFVVLNSADSAALLDKLDTGLPPGTVLRGKFGIDGTPADIVVGARGRVTLSLPARSGSVWLAAGRGAPVPRLVVPRIDGPLDSRVGGNFEVSGTAAATATLRLVVDGAIDAARNVSRDGDGRWRAWVDTGAMVDPGIRHSVVVWDESTGGVSNTMHFRVAARWSELANQADPAGDDAGPDRRYVYPTGPGWRDRQPADIRRVRVWSAGAALKIELTMHEISTAWNPPNGFDHVAFTLFIGLPGVADGCAAMPLQNAALPGGMTWNLRLRAHGWSNALFSSHGASAANEGTLVSPAARISVDRTLNTVTFTLPASALPAGQTWTGARLYATTWDYDGAYRPLRATAAPDTFGGGDGSKDALIMDDTEVITLR